MGKYSTFLKIFTDGSKKGHHTGCAFYVPCLKYGKKFRITDDSSVFSAELFAILKAMEFVLSKPPQQCVIFSDSLNSLQSIQDEDMNPLVQEILYVNYMLSNLGVSISCSWVPSHVGISGNEIVDKLAKESLSLKNISCFIPIGFKDLYPFVDKIFLQKWQERWNSDTKGRFYFPIEPLVSFTCKFSDINRRKQTAITRLRFGKCLLNDLLHLMKKHPTGLCDFCHYPETVPHYLLECIDLQEKWLVLSNALVERGMKINHVNLLKNKVFFNMIWDYILSSGRAL